MSIPAYADLPRLDGLDLPHAWDVWGREDNLGSLNRLDGPAVLRGLAAAKTGERLSLSLPLDVPGPPLFGRGQLTQQLVQQDRNSWDDRLDVFHPQASSQWDGLGHVRCREHGFWTGITADPVDHGDRLGIEHWADGIIGRGVLLDVLGHRRISGAHYDPLAGEAVTADELATVAADQGVDIEPGDILCVRLGWVDAYRALDAHGREAIADGGALPRHSGLAGSEEMAELLWEWGIAAIVADNPSVEVSPGDPSVGSLHRRLLPLLGIVIGELFDLDDLAAACTADDRWTFAFNAVPLRMPGGLGSPANAVAIR